jgi:spore coat protein YsxE
MKLLDQPLSQREKEELIYKEYDFYPRKVEQMGKVRKIVCDRGTFSLKKAAVGQEQLQFLEQCMIYLNKQQFKHYLPFYPNKFGDSYVLYGNEGYYVTPWIEDIVEEKYRGDWEHQMMQCMGELHQLTLGYSDNYVAKKTALSLPVLLQRWHSRLIQMNEYKKFAQNRDIMSPIEATYVANFDYLHELGLRAIRYLKEWKDKENTDKNTRMVLCHGHIHRKNVLHDSGQFYLIDFDQMTIDSPARDLALFYRRHLEKALEGNEDIAFEWLEAYEKEFPLERGEKILLAIYLLFPERVFKEIETYYQGIRDWHPLKQVRYFERQMKVTHLIRHFVKEMLE